MEKTLEMHLAEQRDAIYTAVLDLQPPEPLDWMGKLFFEQARIRFAKAVLEA
jgi:hypothetical protein